MPWPTKGPEFNAWNVDLDKFMKVLDDNREHAFWCCDTQVKYLNLRIDTRDNAFVLTDRDDERISPDRVVEAINRYREKFVTDEACPECGNEVRGQGGYLSCECPSTKRT